MLSIYVDGSCRRNPGPGGFGVIVCEHDWGDVPENFKVIAAYHEPCDQTTNNREEMKAIICALKDWGAYDPVIYSDSSYAINSFSQWINKWKENGWKRDKGQPIENLDLVQEYDKLRNKYHFDLTKVAGHSGILWNEIADKLATGKITVEEVMRVYG